MTSMLSLSNVTNNFTKIWGCLKIASKQKLLAFLPVKGGRLIGRARADLVAKKYSKCYFAARKNLRYS